MTAMSPRNVKDVQDLPQAFKEWEISVKNLKIEHDAEIPNWIKVALLRLYLEIVPGDLPDFIFQQADVMDGFEISRQQQTAGCAWPETE